MKILKSKNETRREILQEKAEGISIGFVPTMGYLHDGHLNLVAQAVKKCDTVVASIYVNPAQFSPKEDLSTYPRNLDRDLSLLQKYGTKYVFCPDDKTMYGPKHLTWIVTEKLATKLCGKSRENHFRGVTTVVAKLLNIVQPDFMFMGEKDFQQVVVLETMIADLDFPTRIVRCPTIRESDGLALSSRNSYLSPEERIRAASLYKSLLMAKNLYSTGITESERVRAEMTDLIEYNKGIVDYIEVIDSETLESIPELEKGCRVALAVKFGNTRLIDNMEI
jgi:pantoate--beta-alanine ligase